MIKFLLGAAVIVGLVGYGVITPQHIETAGDTVREGVNSVLEAGAEATRKTDSLENRVKQILD